MKNKYDYSIILPVYNHWEFTSKCIESVTKFSSKYNYEILVVNNGSNDATAEMLCGIQRKEPRLSFYSCTEALGFAGAINLGMKVAKGEYFIILNNDTKILAPTWIDLLRGPFNKNVNMGVTGPLLLHSWEANCDFIVFFCAMTTAKVARDLNYLSEDFGWGYGEDIDYCKRAVLKGYQIAIVPENTTLKSTEQFWDGGFPIYHLGEGTVNDISNWEGITEENRKKLKNLYREENVNEN